MLQQLGGEVAVSIIPSEPGNLPGETERRVRIQLEMTFAVRRAKKPKYSSSDVKRLSVLLVGIATLAACRPETAANRDSGGYPAITGIDPLFLVPGYEAKIDRRHGVLTVGVVADTVDYDLGIHFPPSEFLDALYRNLRQLGWVIPEYTFSNPPERSSKVAVWKPSLNTDRPMHILEQWWCRPDEVVAVFGAYIPLSDGGDPAQVRVSIIRSHADQAKLNIEEYRRLNGALPTDKSDKDSVVEGDAPK